MLFVTSRKMEAGSWDGKWGCPITFSTSSSEVLPPKASIPSAHTGQLAWYQECPHMSLWGRVHIQTIILGDTFPSVRAPSYDTRDPPEGHGRVALWQWLESDFGRRHRFSGTSQMLGGLGLTAWGAPSLRHHCPVLFPAGISTVQQTAQN